MDLAHPAIAARREARLGAVARLHLGKELGLIAVVEPLPRIGVRPDLAAGGGCRVVEPPAGRRVDPEPGDEPLMPPGLPVARPDRADPRAMLDEERRARRSWTGSGQLAPRKVGRRRAQLGARRLLRTAKARRNG